MEKVPNESKTKQRTNMGTMTMASRSQTGAGISLPSLQEFIPEFFSHHPHRYERKPFSMPRRFSERHSPGPLSAVSDSSTGMTISPSLKRRRLNPVSLDTARERTLTGASPVSSVSEPGNYHIPRTNPGYQDPSSSHPDMNRRRLSSTSQPEGRYLPPVSSLTQSRRSSFELDSSKRTTSHSLPSMFSHYPPSIHSHSSYESDRGRSYPPQDYHYPNPSAPHRPYNSPPPGSQPPGLPPPQATPPAYPPMRTGYIPPAPTSRLDRSAFSPGDQLSRLEMGIEHPYQQEMRPGKRRRGNLPKQVTDILRQWLNEHLAHPYPTEEEKNHLMNMTGLTMNQISNWFINARRRRLPPRTEDTRNGTSSQAGSPRPIGGLLPYPPNSSR